MPTDFDDWDGIFLKTGGAPKEEDQIPKKEAPKHINKQQEALEYVERELNKLRENNNKPVSVEYNLMQAVDAIKKGDKDKIDSYWEELQKSKK